jgi:hypothetical protein
MKAQIFETRLDVEYARESLRILSALRDKARANNVSFPVCMKYLVEAAIFRTK